AIAWSTILGPLFRRLATDPLIQAVTVLYPLGSLGSLVLLSILMLRSAEATVSTRLLALGWTLIVVADVSHLELAARETYSTGAWAGLFWFAGAVVIGLAAALDRPRPPLTTPAHAIGQRWQLVVPVVLLLLARIVSFLQEPGADLHLRPEQVMLGVAALL